MSLALLITGMMSLNGRWKGAEFEVVPGGVSRKTGDGYILELHGDLKSSGGYYWTGDQHPNRTINTFMKIAGIKGDKMTYTGMEDNGVSPATSLLCAATDYPAGYADVVCTFGLYGNVYTFEGFAF